MDFIKLKTIIIKKILLFTSMIIFLGSLTIHSQTKKGQICFIRGTGYVGSIVNDKVYIDNKQVCKLKDKQYSFHTVSVGDHTVSAKSTGLSDGKISTPFTIHVEEDKITYVDLIWANEVSVVEITKDSADATMKSLTQSSSCVNIE